MNSSLILSITTFVYGTAALLYIMAWIFQKNNIGRIAFYVSIIGFLGNLAGFGLRWAESYQLGFGRVPLSNLYESLVFFAVAIVALYLVVEKKQGNRTMGAFVMPIAFLCLAYASISPNISDRISAPFAGAEKQLANCACYYLLYRLCGICNRLLSQPDGSSAKKNKEGRASIWSRIPDRRSLDDLTHRMVMLGFLFLTLGIITGAVWANSAWGRYWGWAPKRLGHLSHGLSMPHSFMPV